MKGVIITAGLISAQDSKRYNYQGYEALCVGDEVDFVIGENFTATEIFLIKRAQSQTPNVEFQNSDLSNVRIFGLLGSIIGMFSAIFYVGWFFAFCAFLLMLLVLHNAAKISGSRTLFINYLKGIIANFIGIGFIWLGVILGAVLFIAGSPSGLIGVIIALFGVFLLVYAFVKWIRTYFELSYLSDNNIFKYFAIIYIIGVCSTWIFGLGYIIMGFAFGLQAFGWWQISQIKENKGRILV